MSENAAPWPVPRSWFVQSRNAFKSELQEVDNPRDLQAMLCHMGSPYTHASNLTCVLWSLRDLSTDSRRQTSIVCFCKFEKVFKCNKKGKTWRIWSTKLCGTGSAWPTQAQGHFLLISERRLFWNCFALMCALSPSDNGKESSVKFTLSYLWPVMLNREALQDFTASQLRLMFAMQPWNKEMTFGKTMKEEMASKEHSFKHFFNHVEAELRKDTPVLQYQVHSIQAYKQMIGVSFANATTWVIHHMHKQIWRKV